MPKQSEVISKREKAWSIRPGSELFDAVNEHCRDNGIKLNFFVVTAVAKKAVELGIIKPVLPAKKGAK